MTTIEVTTRAVTIETTAGPKGPQGDVGPQGPQGIQGVQGDPGPNLVSTSTATIISGLLKGNGANVLAATENTDYQGISAIVSSNTTAANNAHYTVVASATFTDPSPTEGRGYIVYVRNGIATIGGTGYAAGALVYRFFHSGAWGSVNVADRTRAISEVTGLQAALDVRTGHPNFRSGLFWQNTIVPVSPSNTAGTFATGTTQYWPFMVWGKTTVNALRLRVQTAATSGGTGILLGIYASKSDESYPGALMCSATFNNRVAASQQVAVTSTVLQPGLYFFTVRVEASCALTTQTFSTVFYAGGGSLDNGAWAAGWRSTESYAALPATAPGTMDTSTPNNPILVQYGYA